MKTRGKIGLAFTLSIWLLLYLPRIVSEGMFFDGMLYATLARNLSLGFGSFWEPKFSESAFSIFAEHPPLQLFLHSLFYHIFGDFKFIDRLYPTVLVTINFTLIAMLWLRVTASNSEMRQLFWLPILLLAVIPGVSWSYSNNLLENTVSTFTLLSVYLIMTSERFGARSEVPTLIFAGLMIWGGVLSKGLVGLFPLSAAAILWISTGKPNLRKAAIHTSLLIFTVTLVFCFLLLGNSSKAFFERYSEIQLVSSLTGNRGDTGGGFEGVKNFLELFILPVIIGLCILSSEKWIVPRSIQPVRIFEERKSALAFLLIGVSASLPIFISPRISSFYFFPSLPFFMLALAIVLSPSLLRLLNFFGRKGRAVVMVISVATLAFALGLSFANFGKPKRDHSLIHDVVAVGEYIKQDTGTVGATIVIPESLSGNWELRTYFARYYSIDLPTYRGPSRYLLVRKGEQNGFLDKYKPVELNLKGYQLMIPL